MSGVERSEDQEKKFDKLLEMRTGVTLRNVALLAISGIYKSLGALGKGAKLYGSELKHKPARTVVLSVGFLFAVGLTISQCTGSDSDPSESIPSTTIPPATALSDHDVREPLFGWTADDCRGASVYEYDPNTKTLSEALMEQIPGMDASEVLAIADDVATRNDSISDDGDFVPAGPTILIEAPETCRPNNEKAVGEHLNP